MEKIKIGQITAQYLPIDLKSGVLICIIEDETSRNIRVCGV